MFPSTCELVIYSAHDVLEVVHSQVAFLSPVMILWLVLWNFTPSMQGLVVSQSCRSSLCRFLEFLFSRAPFSEVHCTTKPSHLSNLKLWSLCLLTSWILMCPVGFPYSVFHGPESVTTEKSQGNCGAPPNDFPSLRNHNPDCPLIKLL